MNHRASFYINGKKIGEFETLETDIHFKCLVEPTLPKIESTNEITKSSIKCALKRYLQMRSW